MQRYVSSELAHFVGRGHDESKQYQLLVEIVKSGWLTHPPHNPNVSGNLSVTDADFANNEMYFPQVVCFCDIPTSDLAIHSSKYSRFGLSFSKSFLVDKGAVPVWYVPKNGVPAIQRLLLDVPNLPAGMPGAVQQNVDQLGAYFDRMVRANHSVLRRLKPQMTDPRQFDPDSGESAAELQQFWDSSVLSNIKFFDHALGDDDAANFYMEREWRVLGNVRFALSDIQTVFVPKAYGGQLRRDLPTYENQLVFLS